MDQMRRQDQRDHETPMTRSRLLIWINALIVLLLVAASSWVRGTLVEREADNERLREEMATARHAGTRAAADTARQLREVVVGTQGRIDELKADLADGKAQREQLILARKTLLEDIAHRQDAARKAAMDQMCERMQELDTRLVQRFDKMKTELEDDRAAFHTIQRRWDQSIFLVHARFTYKTREGTGVEEEHVGTGWGTGFAVSPDGHIVTNKHVVQPWKFDPELAAMEALGEVEIAKDSVLLAVWRSGQVCMTTDRKPDFAVGYNTDLGNLQVAGALPDTMVTRVTEIAGTGIDYAVHELDNNDVVILKLASKDKLSPLPYSTFAGQAPLQKLDRIMALGFPRGQRGLEAGVAETSPSLGTVRKVEDTIHITASIIPGNSGGPVFNKNGKVVGIATRVYSETLGICLKIDHAISLLGDVRTKEAVAAAERAATQVVGKQR